MAFSAGSGNGSVGRRRSRTSVGSMSEMNVVPLVDVVLVLLIIFMLTAHVMEFGLEMEVPQVKEVQDSAEDLPVVSVTRDAKLYLNETAVKNVNQLGAEIRQRFKDPKAVYLRMDKHLQVEQFVNVADALRQANLKISFVAKSQDVKGP
jgi:biopolymer transport protein ExbD